MIEDLITFAQASKCSPSLIVYGLILIRQRLRRFYLSARDPFITGKLQLKATLFASSLLKKGKKGRFLQ